jgi:hypothetical protein
MVKRKGTETVACVCTGVFLLLFTWAFTNPAVLGFLYAIATPEPFPAPARGTASGMVALFNRLYGVMAPIIPTYVGVGDGHSSSDICYVHGCWIRIYGYDCAYL